MLFDFNPSKAPGPDGLTTLFFQNAWNTIGDDIIGAILGVLNNGESLKDWNDTVTTLIPKIKDPTDIRQFRLISLCNVKYKIVARVITNRLKGIMNHAIGPNQSAFIPGRVITNNVILGFECMHWLRKSKNKQGFAALKLDMSKAYDIVEWSYLRSILSKVGFSNGWVNFIMECVTSVSYSFKING